MSQPRTISLLLQTITGIITVVALPCILIVVLGLNSALTDGAINRVLCFVNRVLWAFLKLRTVRSITKPVLLKFPG